VGRVVSAQYDQYTIIQLGECTVTAASALGDPAFAGHQGTLIGQHLIEVTAAQRYAAA